MKFQIPQGEFTKALLAVNKSLLSRVNLPILSNILISAEGDGLELLSTNMETSSRVKVPSKVETGGKTTLPGKLLLEFISQLPDGDVSFEVLGEEVLVSTKGYNARFATMPVADFPAIPKIEKGTKVEINTKDFSKAILRVAFCAAMDEGRPILTGVLCEFAKDSLCLVATDGYRLAFQKITVKNSSAKSISIVIPAKSVVEVAKIIAEFGEGILDKNVELLIADSLNLVNFKIESVEFCSRLIEGAFPNWQKLIPASFTSKAKVSKEEFIKIVRVASIFARDSGNIVKFKLLAAGKASGNLNGEMSVAATNNQVGSDEARCEIQLFGKGGEIAFNFRYLLEMLSSVDGDEVEFEMIEALNPGRLSLPGESDYFHIVMPVRLQQT